MAPGIAQTVSFVLIMILFLLLFICIYFLQHLFPYLKFLFLQVLLGYLFFWATSSSGLGTVCSFSERVISVWRGELMEGWSNPELCQSCAAFGGFVHLAVLNKQDNLHLSPSVQHHFLHFWARAVKIQHWFWATNPAFSPSLSCAHRPAPPP